MGNTFQIPVLKTRQQQKDKLQRSFDLKIQRNKSVNNYRSFCETRMLNIVLVAFVTIGCAYATPPIKGQLNPRQMTISEIKEESIVPLLSIIEERNATDQEAVDVEVEPPIGWNPPGANEEKTLPKDLVRMPSVHQPW